MRLPLGGGLCRVIVNICLLTYFSVQYPSRYLLWYILWVLPSTLLTTSLGITNTWFRNYLCHRTQIVYIGNTLSSELELLCGARAAGHVLGPLLFLLYINVLPNATAFYNSLFTDDTICLSACVKSSVTIQEI